MIAETPKEQAKRGGAAIGEFIREQREQAQVSLRQLARVAGVSNPYLSQVERGLRKPSADILQQIAKGLRISAEQLYVRAGILESPIGDPGVTAAILSDSVLAERQKQVLIDIYESFRRENADLRRASEQPEDGVESLGLAPEVPTDPASATEAGTPEAGAAVASAAPKPRTAVRKVAARKVAAKAAPVTVPAGPADQEKPADQERPPIQESPADQESPAQSADGGEAVR